MNKIILCLFVSVLLFSCSEPTFKGYDTAYWKGKLKHQDAKARGEAAYALGELAPTSECAIEDLKLLLEDQSAEVRYQACWAFFMIGSPAKSALPKLRNLLSDKEQMVKEAALAAIKEIEGK